ncbi:MAG: helix-turn-helix transcriptional regulator, partial [Chloroflexi bacterium]|nr:helix-turn-helix transcriptional regulator [Chloroflexota bacterium]
ATFLSPDTPVPPQHEEKRWRLVDEMEGRTTVGVTPSTLAHWLFYSGLVCLNWGDRTRAEAQWEEQRQLAQRSDDAIVHVRSLVPPTVWAFIDGRLEESVSAAEHLHARADELGALRAGLLFASTVSWRALQYTGRSEEALVTLSELESSGEGFISVSLSRLPAVLAHAHRGPSEEAREVLQGLLRTHPYLLEDASHTFVLDALLQIAVLLEDRELCSVLAERLAPVSSLSSVGFVWTCPARHLGAAAALLGEPDKARAYYHEALEAAAKIRFRPEIALTRLQLAELLLDHYPDERAEAMEHLDFAIGEFRDMKMQPSLERAVALQEKTATPATRPTYPDGLTRREVEVLRLIAAGSSNREIADELVLSVRTVERHINNIYRKIDARGRTAAVAYALTHDMNDPT